MYYFRRPVGTEWKEFKLDEAEVRKVMAVTASKCLDVLVILDEVAAKKGVTLPAEDRRVIFGKMAPSYDSIAVDFIMKQMAAKKEAEAKASGSAQTSAAAVA